MIKAHLHAMIGGRQRLISRRVQRPALILTVLIMWLLVSLFYQFPPAIQVPGADLSTQFHGIYPAEQLGGREASFTGQNVRFKFAGPVSSNAFIVQMILRTPGDISERQVNVSGDSARQLQFPVNAAWRNYRFVLPAENLGPWQRELHLQTDVSSFPNDGRELGIIIAGMNLQSHQLWHILPLMSVAGLLLILLLIGGLLIYRVGLPLSAAVILSAIILLAARPVVVAATSQQLYLAVAGMGGLHLFISNTQAIKRRWQTLRPERFYASAIPILLALLLICWFLNGQGLLTVTLQLVGIFVVTLALLLYAGFGLTWFLRSRQLAPVLPLFTPVVGVAALSGIGHAIGYLPFGTDVTVWPILLLFTVINTIAWRRGARPHLPRPLLLALPGAATALLLGLLPSILVGYLTTLGGSIDAISYVVRAEYLQSSGLLRLPPATLMVPPYMQEVGQQMRDGMRQGDVFILATVSSLLETRPYVAFQLIMLAWFALTPVGIFVLAVYELKFSRRTALIASLLVAIQPLLYTPILKASLSQPAAIATWPFVLVAVLAALRHGTWRTITLAGLLLAGMATLYFVYLLYLVPIAGLIAGYDWAIRSRKSLSILGHANTTRQKLLLLARRFGVLVRRSLAMSLVALISIPTAWILLERQTRAISGLVTREGIVPGAQGDVLVFPHVGEIVGVINHLQAVYDRGLPEFPLGWATLIVVLILPLLVYAVIRATMRQRFIFITMALVLGAAVWQQRFWLDQGRGYPYGYYKTVSLISPLLMLALVHGSTAFYQRVAALRLPFAIVGRSFVVAIFAALCGIASYHNATNIEHLGDTGAVATAPIIEIQEAVALLPPGEPVVILDGAAMAQMWTGYFFNRPNTYYRRPTLTYWSPTQSYSSQVIEHALIADLDPGTVRLDTEPWYDLQQQDILWRNDRYVLTKRKDTSVLADLPLILDDRALELSSEQAVEIILTETAIKIPDVKLRHEAEVQQFFSEPAGTLELTFASESDSKLRIDEQGRLSTIPIDQHNNRVLLDIEGSTRISLTQEPGSSIRLIAVRVLRRP